MSAAIEHEPAAPDRVKVKRTNPPLHNHTTQRRRRVLYLAKHGLTPELVTTGQSASSALWIACLSRLAPWRSGDYPGQRRLALACLGRPITWGAVKHWERDRQRLPQWAALHLAEVLRSRAAGDLALASRLAAHAASLTPPLVHQVGLTADNRKRAVRQPIRKAAPPEIPQAAPASDAT